MKIRFTVTLSHKTLAGFENEGLLSGDPQLDGKSIIQELSRVVRERLDEAASNAPDEGDPIEEGEVVQ